MTMTADIAKQLRAPFPPEHIGKLPKITCRDCSQTKFTRKCDKHSKSTCRVCGNYITEKHTHLDYVGHAETTDRLLQVDPEWTWEPMAFGPDGLPAIDSEGGLWIRLTVAEVSRIGYGHANGKEGPDAIKEAIGDAIRNAAMRFGVALDLWGAHGAEEDGGEAADSPAPKPVEDTPKAARAALAARAKKLSVSIERVSMAYLRINGNDIASETDPRKIRAFSAQLENDPRGVLGEDEPKAAA